MAGDTPRRRSTDGEPSRAATRFQELFTAIDEGYCLCEIVVDGEGTAIDYRFLETNPVFEEMTGLVDAEGRLARELVPGLEDHWVETYGRVALGGERMRFEQGSEAMGRWFDVFAMPVGDPGQFAIVFKDDTARHRALLELKESERRHRDRAKRERETSHRLQRALLPDGLVEDPRVRISAYYSAGSVGDRAGGDWYDSFRWHNGRVGVMVGDVVGHGIESAAAMGRLRAAVGALAPHTAGSPAALLSALGACADGPGGCDFVTSACVALDATSGELWYSRAGHPPPLLVYPDGGTRWLDDAGAPPLGALVTRGERWEGDQSKVRVSPGACAVLYSDGLVERRRTDIRDGLDHLAAVAPAAVNGDDPAASIAEAVLGESPASDDVVVVVMRCLTCGPWDGDERWGEDPPGGGLIGPPGRS